MHPLPDYAPLSRNYRRSSLSNLTDFKTASVSPDWAEEYGYGRSRHERNGEAVNDVNYQARIDRIEPGAIRRPTAPGFSFKTHRFIFGTRGVFRSGFLRGT